MLLPPLQRLVPGGDLWKMKDLVLCSGMLEFPHLRSHHEEEGLDLLVGLHGCK
jgi:hypothetical protein